MRRVVLLLIIAILVPSLAGCSGTGTAEPITIQIWDGPRPSAGDNKFAWIESVIAEWKRSNPGVNVVLTKVPWQEIVTRLDQHLASGNYPDIVPLYPGPGGIRLEHLEKGLVEPTDEYFREDGADLFPAAKDGVTYNGKMYGFPYRMSLQVMLLNREIFEERKVALPKDGNWTYNEFLQTAKQLTFVRPKSKTQVYGFATYVNKGYYEIWPFLYMDGARPLSRDMAVFTLDSKEGISAVTKLVDLKYKHKVALPETGSSDHSLIWRAFASPHERRVAMEPWPDWAIMMAATDPRFKTDISVARYPTGDQKKPVSLGSVYAYSVLAQQDKQKRKLAMELCRAITGSTGQLEFAESFGWLPARKSVAQKSKFPHPELSRAAGFLTDVEVVPFHPKWVQIENSINASVQTALIGERLPEQALQDARREVEALISLPR